jgi:hypothetical protein
VKAPLATALVHKPSTVPQKNCSLYLAFQFAESILHRRLNFRCRKIGARLAIASVQGSFAGARAFGQSFDV